MANAYEDASAVRLTASQMTAGKADLLIGAWIYPCRHKFSWILDYHLLRTGRRAPGIHTCPKCSVNPTCLVCLGRFDAANAESCPSCEQFFAASLLPARRAKLVAMNVRVLDERADVYLRARLEHEKERFREKWGAWADMKGEEGD
ncbi:hypothetical protein HD806DRAFT_528029 [Xylariaceae sp. AK1471]|nr:hypothetical protein HD806DRAFT_528029 [Xylariaceae sp. AK1471]